MLENYNEKSLKSIGWFILHCLIFASISILTKYIMQFEYNGNSISIFQILGMQTLFGTIFLLILRRDIFRPFPAKKSLVIHFVRALLWVAGTILFFLSLSSLPLPKTMALSFSTPLFTIILAILILKEILYRHYVIAIIFGFVGMLIVIRPGINSFEPASLMVILACFLWSFTDIIIKHMGKLEKNATITWFNAFFSFLLITPLMIAFWVPISLTQFMLLLVLGMLYISNLMALTYSYRIGELTLIQPFAFTQLLFVSILSFILFNELISITTILGSGFIICGASVIAHNERKKRKEWLAYRIGRKIIAK
ncbi:MAG: DMT family transporter [Pseudomonadota bacterium]